MKVLFLDLDGVVRIPSGKTPPGGDDFDFCPERMKMLAEVLRQSDVKIVISSDWRIFEERQDLERDLSPHLAPFFHDDWMTPILGGRWKEIGEWLDRHPETTRFAVIDDFHPHFEDCDNEIGQHLVLCDTQTGITADKLGELRILLCGEEKGHSP